jgi:hypothetical protein
VYSYMNTKCMWNGVEETYLLLKRLEENYDNIA